MPKISFGTSKRHPYFAYISHNFPGRNKNGPDVENCCPSVTFGQSIIKLANIKRNAIMENEISLPLLKEVNQIMASYVLLKSARTRDLGFADEIFQQFEADVNHVYEDSAIRLWQNRSLFHDDIRQRLSKLLDKVRDICNISDNDETPCCH